MEEKQKKVRTVKLWEALYLAFIYALLGFYFGFELGSSSSWVVPILEEKYTFSLNFPMILGFLAVIYIVIDWITSRKSKGTETKDPI